MTIASRDSHQFSIRFASEGLIEALRVSAAQNNRSINSEINARLMASFEASSASGLHSELAAAIDRHVEGLVAQRLREIAAATLGSVSQ